MPTRVPENEPTLMFDECTVETSVTGDKLFKWWGIDPMARGGRTLLFLETFTSSGVCTSYTDNRLSPPHRVSIIASPVSMPPKVLRKITGAPVGSATPVAAPTPSGGRIPPRPTGPVIPLGARPIGAKLPTEPFSLPAGWPMFAHDELVEIPDKASLDVTRSWYMKGTLLWHEVIGPPGTVKSYRNHGVAVPFSPTPPSEEEPVADPSVPKSCLTCSNFMTRSAVPTRYGRQVGSAMCAKLDKPIGRSFTSSDPEALKYVADKIGSNCASYNKPREAAPKRIYQVAFPNNTTPERPGGDDKVSTCYSCKNYTPSDVVIGEWGWSTGACSQYGTLVPEHNVGFVGKACHGSEFGEQRTTLLGVQLFPEYEEDFLTQDLIGEFLKSDAFDPASHPTDKPITEADTAQGIRAWKYVADKERPSFNTQVFLPIYDTTKMDPDTLSKIPRTGDDEHPESYLDHNNAVYKIAVLWTELDETPALWGPAGVGKTELFRFLAWMMQLPFERISITASTELDDLAGKMHFDPTKGTYFEYGRLPQAWQKPSIICIDEPNVGAPDVWQFLRPLTDNSKQLVLDMNEGERISRHLDAYMGMAMNPAWDPRNVGAAVIGDADGSRLMHIAMDLPPEKIEREIITTRCKLDGYEIPPKVLKSVMQIGKEIRGLTEQGALPLSWGVRNQIKVARATRWFSLAAAYKIAVGDYLEPQQAEQILDVVKANDHTG